MKYERFRKCRIINNIFLNILFIFLERVEGREKREGEKHQCVDASHAPPNGDLSCNPGMCPDWELNQGTTDPWVCRPALNPLSDTSQG